MSQLSAGAAAGTHFVVVPHTHWDREWYRPFEDFRRRLVTLVDRLLDILDTQDDFPVFHFDGQTIVLDDYVQIRPHQERRLRKHLKNGRIQIGPWRVLPDQFLVTGESLIRNLQQGHADCARWGVEPLDIGYTPDMFGHIGTLPQILAGFGCRAGMVWRGVGPDVQRTQFWWESPDGTRLFTIYLPMGYGNGATLPERVEPLVERLEAMRGEQEAFCTIPSLLVMNGSDHLEAQGRIPALLAEAVGRKTEWSFEMGGLGTFVDQARDAAGDDLAVHVGEFRHPWRANILPGVTSVRTYQKQRDFELCGALEKYVEPMCAWAERLGDRRGAQDFIDYVWRLLVENHPHDSICGCSVDAVHDEMDTRWDKAEQVIDRLRREALDTLSSRCATSGLGRSVEQVLLTYSPARPPVQLVDLELGLDHPDALRSVRATDGTHYPVQLTAGDREVYMEATLPVDELRTMVEGLQGREVLGYTLNNIMYVRQGSLLLLTLICAHHAYGDIDIDAKRQELLDVLADSRITEVHAVLCSATRTRLTAVLPVSGQTGLDAFGLTSRKPAASERMLRVGTHDIETDDLALHVQDDGSLTLRDKRTGRTWDRALRLVDDGDRGDTYNFDPVPGGAIVAAPAEPVTCTVVADGPVAATLAIDATYTVPAALTEDRDARAEESVDMPMRVEVTCYRDLARVDVRVTVENTAEDHRLRATIDLPFAPAQSIAEGPFGIVRREVALPAMRDTVEHFYGTAPKKTFVCVENGEGGIALASRGIQEYEATAEGGNGTLALTLLRCVGWLSRDDLAMRNNNSAGPKLETPGAQSPGVQTFEFALIPYAGDYASAGIPGAAHAYAFPPIGTRTGRHRGRIRPGTRFVDVEELHVVVSAATLSSDRKDVLVRVYNEAERSVETDIAFDGTVRGITSVDLREARQSREGETVNGDRVHAALTPSQIRTWRVRRPRSRA